MPTFEISAVAGNEYHLPYDSPFQRQGKNAPPMRYSHFDQRLAALGALPVHRGRILRVWLQGQALKKVSDYNFSA